MKPRAYCHEWVIASPGLGERGRDIPSRPGGNHYEIDAHRRHRGPYTAAGELVRRLIAGARSPVLDLIARHQLTLLAVAPELRNGLAVSEEMDNAFKFSREGNARAWTLRISHGIVDFILDYCSQLSPSGNSVSFENAGQADPLDQEFMAILLRRADPEQLRASVRGASDRVTKPLGDALKAHARKTALKAHARRTVLRSSPPAAELSAEPAGRSSHTQRFAWARAYVESDCTSDRSSWKNAYASLPEAERMELHGTRAALLEARGEFSLSLGAIPFHREQAGEGAAALLAASDYCMRMAYYDSALDAARRGRGAIVPEKAPEVYGEFTRNMLFALLLLGRHGEVEALCRECEAESKDPALLAHATYALAILNARLYDRARHDYDAAKAWVEKSLAFTESLPPSETRAVNTSFLLNTLALVHMRKGNHAAALDLLDRGLDHMAAEAADRYGEESVILWHNRARLQIAAKRFDRAVEDLTTLLGLEPSNSEAHFDRGVLYQRAGRYNDALRDYDAAIRWSPPYFEPHFNRAQTRVALGRGEAALTDYDRVLVLRPDHVEARVNRACLRLALGRFEDMRDDLDAAFALSPGNARLLCLRGLLKMKRGDLNAAARDFTAAAAADPMLPDSWANRATVRFKQGDEDAALRDLDQALNLREDAEIRYNRGRILESRRRWQDAAEDYRQALTLTAGDAEHILRHLDICRREMGVAGAPAKDAPPVGVPPVGVPPARVPLGVLNNTRRSD